MRRWPWSGQAHTPRARLGRWLLGIVLVWLLLLLVVKLAGPALIEHFVEKSLSDMPGGYQGTIEHVDLRMLSAEVALVGLQIEKKNGKVPVPFMKTELVMGTVADGFRPRTTLRFSKPVIRYVDAPNEAEKQTGPKVELADIRKQLPFELIAVYIDDAEIHFLNFQTKPPIDAHLSGFNLTWDKLVGCMPPGSTACHSEVAGKGALMKGAGMALKGTFERLPEPTFKAKASIRRLQVAQLSPLLKHYAKFDLQRGRLDVDARLTQKGENKSAFVVPRLEDVDVMGGDQKDTAFFRELGVAAAAGWFERKSGKKAVLIKSGAGGKTEFEVVDLKREDREDDDQDQDSKDR